MKGVLILISLVVVSVPTVCSQEAGPSTHILIGNRLERFVLMMAFATVGPVSAQSADSIIDKYLKVRGGYKKLKSIKTVRMTGTYQEGNSRFGTYIEWKRPFFRVVVIGIPNEVYREGFNGTSWEFATQSGELKINEPSSAASMAARRGAEFDESIIDYRAKGHKIELLGAEKLDDQDVYHLRVTLNDGWIKDYYLDTKTYLTVALQFPYMRPGRISNHSRRITIISRWLACYSRTRSWSVIQQRAWS